MQVSEMRLQLQERGHLLAEQLAPLAAPAMAQGYSKRLQRILNQILDQPDVRSVAALDTGRNLLAHAGPNMITPSPPADPEALPQVSSLETTRILMPVQGRHLNLAPGAPDNAA